MYRCQRDVVVGVMDLVPNKADALAHGVCRCEESGDFTVAFGVARQCSNALHCFRCRRVGIDAGGTGERCMGVAFSLIGFTAGPDPKNRSMTFHR